MVIRKELRTIQEQLQCPECLEGTMIYDRGDVIDPILLKDGRWGRLSRNHHHCTICEHEMVLENIHYPRLIYEEVKPT